MIKIEDINRPVKVGESYLVPCVVRHDNSITYITPVINHPHNDVENGQKEVHYHVDYRFLKHKNDDYYPTVVNKHSKYYFAEEIRPQKGVHGKLEYFIMPVINEEHKGITPSFQISKSKLKHKCIHKGKCPHRGFDLSQVKPKDGVIKCPLHGLIFNETSKELLK